MPLILNPLFIFHSKYGQSFLQWKLFILPTQFVYVVYNFFQGFHDLFTLIAKFSLFDAHNSLE